MAGGNPPKLSKEKRAEYMKVFNDLDENGDGSLSREEIGNWLRQSGYAVSDRQVEAIFRVLDADGNGKISLDEFYQAMAMIESQADQRENIRRVFRNMDANGDGRLSKEELFQGFSRCGYSLTHDAVDRIFRKIDANGDGFVDFEEFLRAFQEHLL